MLPGQSHRSHLNALRNLDQNWAPEPKEEDEFADFICADDEVEMADGGDGLDSDEDDLIESARRFTKTNGASPIGKLRNGRVIEKREISTSTKEILEHGFDDVIERCEELTNTLSAILESKANSKVWHG